MLISVPASSSHPTFGLARHTGPEVRPLVLLVRYCPGAFGEKSLSVGAVAVVAEARNTCVYIYIYTYVYTHITYTLLCIYVSLHLSVPLCMLSCREPSSRSDAVKSTIGVRPASSETPTNIYPTTWRKSSWIQFDQFLHVICRIHYICIYIHTYTHLSLLNICTHVCVCSCTRACMYVCTFIQHTRTYTHTHTHTHSCNTCMHACIHLFKHKHKNTYM